MSADKSSKVLFVDLDGTLVLDNSYHAFLWAMWVEAGVKLRFAIVRAALTRVFWIALRRYDGRVRMKRSLLHAFAKGNADYQRAVVTQTLAKMKETVSQPVMEMVSRYQAQGWLVVIATAAPDCYARPFGEMLGFDDCLASPPVTTPASWVELIGESKAQACKRWIEAKAGPTTCEVAAISDHCEDLPLLRMASRVAIQAPPDEMRWLMAELPAKTSVEQIDPVGCDEHGGMWLWINDRPSGPHDSWEVRTILSKHRYALLYRGGARWSRVLPGHSLSGAALRAECPRPPTPRDRISVAARRLLVRDVLGVFH